MTTVAGGKTAATPLVIACDESGNDGENLLAGSSPVFAHASVTMSEAEARAIMDEVRARTGSLSVELKSKTLLQHKHETTARWLMDHPVVVSHASIHLTHKRYFLVAKLFDMTVEELANDDGYDMYADGSALAGANILFFTAPALHGGRWDQLLVALQGFLRAKTPQDASAGLALLDAAFVKLLSAAAQPDIFLTIAHAGVEHLKSYSQLQLGEGIDHRLRALDPLVSAVGSAVIYWAQKSRRPIEVVHDAAKEMTPERAEAMKVALASPEVVAPHRAGQGVELVGLSLVDSKLDSRVQVADLLAGLGHAVAQPNARGAHPLTNEVQALVSDMSIWPNPDLMDPVKARAVASSA